MGRSGLLNPDAPNKNIKIIVMKSYFKVVKSEMKMSANQWNIDFSL